MNNKFKLYPNKSSLKKSRSRMLNGGETDIKGSKLGWWERRPMEREEFSDITITIDAEYDRRPDLVAYDFFGYTSLMWLVLQYNNIVDIEEEFREGMEVVLPSKARALSELSDSGIRNDT